VAPLGLLLGVVGMLQVIATRLDNESHKQLNDTWLFILINTLPLFIFGTGTFLDHFWAARRFVPVVFPTLLLFAAHLLWSLVPNRREKWSQGLLPLGLTIALVASLWQRTRPIVGIVDYNGITKQIAQLDELFSRDAVLLFERSDVASRVSTPMWFLFDRTVFNVRDEAKDDLSLIAAIEYWQKLGRDVYWIDTNGEDLPVLPGYVPDYAWTVQISTPLSERTVNRLPAMVGSYRAALDVYSLAAETDVQTLKRALTLDLIFGKQDEHVQSGLYELEVLSGLTPLRWTSGQVNLEMLIDDQPTVLLLQMANGRPADVPAAEVNVYLGGWYLGTTRVDGQATIYEFPISKDMVLPEESAELRLEMIPWIPAETGFSSDQRELGVYLNWVKLVVARPMTQIRTR
jgi:hypothetical protein